MDKVKVYRKNVKIDFEGNALLLQLNSNYKIKEELKLETGQKIKKNGIYEIIYKNMIIKFKIKKVNIIFILFLLFIVLSFCLGTIVYKNSSDSDIYIFDSSNINFQNISLTPYNKSSLISNKIAPGTKGKFKISIENLEEKREEYYFKYDQNNYKPQNLIFFVKDKKFNNLGDLIEYLNIEGITEETIYWEWEFTGNDVIDTINGEKNEKYMFSIALYHR